MINRNSLVLLIFMILTFEIKSQELIPMGTWRSHFNYEQTHLVENTSSKIFAATSHGLMFYDQEDQSINKLSKVDGLSDVGITALAYNSGSEYLAIGYQNGNLDMIDADGIKNLSVLLNSDVTENKMVNHVSFYNGNMNLATDFGLLVLTTNNQVVEAYQNLGENGEVIEVRSSTIFQDIMYLATEDGVLSGDLTNGDNLQDFNNWERFTASPVYMSDIVSISTVNGAVYSSSSSTLYKWSGSSWSVVALGLNSTESIMKIREGLNGLLILTNQRTLSLNDSDESAVINLPTGAEVNDVLQESTDVFWYADESLGLSNLESDVTKHIVLDGPLNDVEKLKIESGELYAFPALEKDFTNPITDLLGYSIFTEGEWTTVKPEDLNGLSNISDVVNFNDQKLYASFGNGMLSVANEEMIDYNNSPLEEKETGTSNTLVSGLALDQSNDIWVANFSAYSLMKWNGGDEWEQHDFGTSAGAEPTSIVINSQSQVWMTLGLLDGRGVLAYDIEANANRYVTAAGTSLPSNQVNDIAFGKDDEIWFATDKGVAYFPFSFGIVEDQTIDVSLPIFDQSILFEDKQVYAMAVDGGNRIWFGTQDGLWLFDENISSLVEHFTVENSPLPSNVVKDLAIHPESGELFILTDQGIVSYRTNATDGTNVHHQVKIYPNPVLPGFDGWVGMSGLANDVRIKITTISGQLVKEVNAAGGGASWDVRDYSGRKVSSGVYLVFSADQEGNDTFVGKIAVLN